MPTAVFTHPACLDHDPGRGHPESPARLRVVLEALKRPEFAALKWREAPRATDEQLERVHDRTYIAQLMFAIPQVGVVDVTLDTAVSAGSGEAALRAAGAVCAAVDAVMGGEASNAFCPVRPPGHHAGRDHPMGFCLFNNIAVAAMHARAAHGLKRIAVVDFDVHHGNGTQDAFAADPDLFYGSTHQWPAYPGTGAASETGVGNIFNAPLAPQSGSAEFRAAMTRIILPALSDFSPEFVLMSAGFDAHAGDPLASLRLHEDDFLWVTQQVRGAASALCKGRLVSTLEGGYELTALAESAAAHVRGLMAS
ncbi:MAG: histone deacetylase family protein [Alphaproteobacteria bacterium]